MSTSAACFPAKLVLITLSSLSWESFVIKIFHLYRILPSEVEWPICLHFLQPAHMPRKIFIRPRCVFPEINCRSYGWPMIIIKRNRCRLDLKEIQFQNRRSPLSRSKNVNDKNWSISFPRAPWKYCINLFINDEMIKTISLITYLVLSSEILNFCESIILIVMIFMTKVFA